jgi:hypothetical protein
MNEVTGPAVNTPALHPNENHGIPDSFVLPMRARAGAAKCTTVAHEHRNNSPTAAPMVTEVIADQTTAHTCLHEVVA